MAEKTMIGCSAHSNDFFLQKNNNKSHFKPISDISMKILIRKSHEKST